MPAKIRFSLLTLALLVSGQVVSLPAQATTTLSQMAPIAQPQIASGSALIVDLTSGKTLFSSHPDRVRPIASITKLMTAMVVLDAHQPMNEMVTVDISQTPEMRGVFSRVKLNSQISRRSMLMLALMSSENRAAASLAHAYPGGYNAFIKAMNAKARALGMNHTHYVEPTGLSIHNVSSAEDLVKLLKATREYPLLGELSTTKEETAVFTHPSYALPFRNTNHLVYKNGWHIQLTKTGYTDEAGHCLVMRTMIKNRPVALVVLDAFGKYTHFADANRLRDWLETGKAAPRFQRPRWPIKNRKQVRLPAMLPAVLK
jgi:D-alanyl-D-alanine endopeptidase (penicillin-binding protein 7)